MPEPGDRQAARHRCPKLGPARHGSWYFSADLRSVAGERQRVRCGGFATKAAAVVVLEALSSPVSTAARGLTTGEWLDRLAGVAGVASW